MTLYIAIVFGGFGSLALVCISGYLTDLASRVAERHAREDREDAETAEPSLRLVRGQR